MQTELAAGCGDVVAFFAAERRDDLMAAQDGEKTFLLFSRRARPLEAFDRVVRDEIDASAQAAGVMGQEMSLFFGVVNAGDQNVFEVDALLLAAGVVIAGGKKSR